MSELLRIPDTAGIHRLQIHFDITENIRRSVFLYLIVGSRIHLIDTGVDGAQVQIADYLHNIGRDIREISSIILTHTHPDHIGSAHAFRQFAPNCQIMGSLKEKEWVENIDLQFAERPIPNFYALVGNSVLLDRILTGGEIIQLEDGINLTVIDSKGHSQGSLSYYWHEQGVLFSGDAIPVQGDIPIFTSLKDSIETLIMLKKVTPVNLLLSAWDDVRQDEEIALILENAIMWLENIQKSIKNKISVQINMTDKDIFYNVCNTPEFQGWTDNPLFRKSIYSAISEIRGGI
jgi:glyoxylase-like metal-dependent hydrolase (beta-lactamase superfamily II)